MDFASRTGQYNYFYGRRKFTWDEYNYQRQNHSIVVSIPGGVDALSSVNYLMYQNTNFKQADGTYKWF